MNGPRVTAGKGGAHLWVRVQPRARRAGVEGLHGERLKIALTAPPVEGAANEALLRFLADAFDVPPSTLQVVVGATSREKTVEFRSLGADAVLARATALLGGATP